VAGSTTVSCTLTVPAVKLFTATINGSTTVAVFFPETPGGGFVFSKRPPIRTRNLRPRHATILVTAFAPYLTITGEPDAATVRTRPLAPMPTLTFQGSARSQQPLGELPRSKRELIDKLVIYDTV
jgi:hypothetical protein